MFVLNKTFRREQRCRHAAEIRTIKAERRADQAERRAEEAEEALRKMKAETLICSFCGKDSTMVRKLIAGPKVFICSECVELCVDIIKEELRGS